MSAGLLSAADAIALLRAKLIVAVQTVPIRCV